MKERPILFSGPMVRAILEERKTQTRRVTSDQGASRMFWHEGPTVPKGEYAGWVAQYEGQHLLLPRRCPYGVPGDRLWVRETHYRYGHWDPVPGVKTKKGRMKWRFVADTTQIIFDPKEYGLEERFGPIRKGRHHKDPSTMAWHKRLGRFMPKSASRITLEITDVRVQRLQEIGEEDAMAEGCPAAIDDGLPDWTAKVSFKILWDSINGKKHPWANNDWVWAVSFRRVDAL